MCSLDDKSIKDSMLEILDITSGYGGHYNPFNKDGSAEELAILIDNIRNIAKDAIRNSHV